MEAGQTFGQRWGWIYYIDTVSERVRDTWRNVQDINIVEFLNILAYIRDKNEFDKQAIKSYKRK